MPSYRVVGVMSGTSLDGLDVALCTLALNRGRWKYRIEEARTLPYPAGLKRRLETAMQGSAETMAQLDADLGRFVALACKRYAGRATLIASHGHTIFHQPRLGFSTQIGSGAWIAAVSGLTTVCGFRSADVALGGQGAPLVPLGEKLLFPGYKAFVNIGGICNVSLHAPNRTIGYDVCIGNQALNLLANEGGAPFDRNGALARKGRVNDDLLTALNSLAFFQKKPPKSLGREWFDAEVFPLIAKKRIALEDRMRTVVEHIAMQLGKALRKSVDPVLVTGGGAHNGFLIERLSHHANVPVVVPDERTVDFKEALVFALLGVLRIRGEVNALASVTGAKRDSVGGAVHLAN